jgi:hypothetical protein
LGASIGTMALPGIGTVAGALGGNLIGYGLQGDGIKNDLALGAIAPPLLIAKKLGLTDKLIRKTTRQYAQENTKALLEQGQDDPVYQAYVQGMREQYNSAPPDPSKPFAGKYKSWDEYKQAGLEAADLTGVYGNIKAYGPAWAKLTQEQRQAVTQANINSGIYDSKKGDVIITDEAKAKANFDAVVNSGATASPTQPAATTPPATTTKPAGSPLAQSAATGATQPTTKMNAMPNRMGKPSLAGPMVTPVPAAPTVGTLTQTPGGMISSLPSMPSTAAPFTGIQGAPTPTNAAGKPLQIVYDQNGNGRYVDPDGGPVPLIAFTRPGSPASQAVTPAQAAAQGALMQTPARSQTLSPGIGLNGQRIAY